MRKIVGSIEAEYRRYQRLAEGAIEQLDEGQLSSKGQAGENSIAAIVWHISGNLESRFTDFLSSDGEKAWRDRESEFAQRTPTRKEMAEKWEKGWATLFGALKGLDDLQLDRAVTIRGVELSVLEALLRSLAHASYHVGQILFLSKQLRGDRWRYLSIPPGESAAYNQNPVLEKPPG